MSLAGDRPTVAIVGLGPKGLYCLESLLHAFEADPLPGGLNIQVFNRRLPFGVSVVYDQTQPDYILANVRCGKVDLWLHREPRREGRLDFLSWHRERFPSAGELDGTEFVPRWMLGDYLAWAYRQLEASLPAGVTLEAHVGEVVDVEPADGCYHLHFVDADGRTSSTRAHKVMLATGHSPPAGHADGKVVPFAYPLPQAVIEVPAGASVAMKGLGLTFTDAVLALTEGRGGRFEPAPEGELVYHRSGEEPSVIYPFTRTGLPMAPKAVDRPVKLRPLVFLTPSRIEELLGARPVDFEKELLPEIELEMAFQYYRVAMENTDRAALEHCAGDRAAMLRLVEDFHARHPERPRFDFRKVLDPLPGRFDSPRKFTAAVERYLQGEVARAKRGFARSPTKAAINMWSEVKTALEPVFRFGGLTPESQKKLLEHYLPRFHHVVFGPPVVSSEKTLALLRAGVVDVSLAVDARVATEQSAFRLTCAVLGTETKVERLIDARFPLTGVEREPTTLFANLRRRGLVREYAHGSAYCSGAIDMTPDTQLLIAAGGEVSEDLAVVGVPTEGNLLNNLTLVRDRYPDVWAKTVLDQLRSELPAATVCNESAQRLTGSTCRRRPDRLTGRSPLRRGAAKGGPPTEWSSR